MVRIKLLNNNGSKNSTKYQEVFSSCQKKRSFFLTLQSIMIFVFTLTPSEANPTAEFPLPQSPIGKLHGLCNSWMKFEHLKKKKEKMRA